MSIRNLERLFRPESVALIGASRMPHSVGAVLARNLFKSGFEGPVMPVNPKYRAIEGVLAYPDVDSLPMTPDLAVLSTPPDTVPELIGKLAERGTKAAVVVTAGFGESRALRLIAWRVDHPNQTEEVEVSLHAPITWTSCLWVQVSYLTVRWGVF